MFTGFSKAGLQFLRELKENNDRDWFRERKHIYEETVQQPMAQLVTEVAAGCRKRGLEIYANDKNPVMRVYRDVRFSSNKSPYKTHVGGSLRARQSKSNHGEMYLHISPEEPFLAAGFWMPERPFLHAWRESMVQDSKRFQKVLTALTKAKLALSDENALTRMPRGFDAHAEGPLADVFKKTSYVVSRKLTTAECGSPELVAIGVQFALNAKPLLEYGWNIDYTPRKDILER